MPTESLDLVALQALCDAASDGPWAYEEHEVTPQFRHHSSIGGADGEVVGAFWDDDGDSYGGLCVEPEDAAFITAAREALPVLIAEVRLLRAEARAPCGACGHEWPNEEAP